MDLHSYIIFWVCVVGLCLGSFYNVVILRSLSGESIVFPPSKCPKCSHKLFWWHNIPVLSFLILKGKCFFCKESISIQYPIVEMVTMILFLISYLKFGISYTTLFVILWVSCFIIMSVTDLKSKLVDCNIAILMAVSGFLYNYLNAGWKGVLYSLLGLIAGVLIIETVSAVGYLLKKGRAVGEGDTYVAGAIGAIFCIKGLLYAMVLSLAVSMIFILPYYFYNKYKSGDGRTCITAVCFTLSVLIYSKLWQNYFTFLILLILGILLAYFVIKGIDEQKQLNYLPFVPALALGSLIYIFAI